MLVNPNLGTLLCKGIGPPSNPIFLEYPDLDLAPLCPRVELPPLPEPSDLPTRVPSLWTAPCAGLRLCNAICRYYVGLLCGNQVLYLTYHAKDIGRGIVFDNMPALAQAKCLQGPFLVLWPFDRAPNLFYLNLCHNILRLSFKDFFQGDSPLFGHGFRTPQL